MLKITQAHRFHQGIIWRGVTILKKYVEIYGESGGDGIGAFEDIFEQYTRKHSLASVKNSNMGSLYKLTYIIRLKNDEDIRKFTDALRARNGNLEISISHAEGNEEL